MYRRSRLPHRVTSAPRRLTAGKPDTALRPLLLTLHLSIAGPLLCAAAWPVPARAEADAAQTRRYDIAAGPLTTVLNRFAQEAGVLLSAPGGLTAGKASAGLRGTYGVEAGLATLLSGQGLEAVRQTNGAYLLRALPAATSGSILALRATPGP